MKSRYIEKSVLKNDLTVEIYDESRKIAGDRWQVEFVACIKIEVRQYGVDSVSGTVPLEKLKEVLGDTVQFEYRSVRNFVDDREKKTIFEHMQAGFDSNVKPYCNHPEFAARFILKEFRQRQYKQKS